MIRFLLKSQLGLFGPRKAEVKAHVRKTTKGVVPVQQHQRQTKGRKPPTTVHQAMKRAGKAIEQVYGVPWGQVGAYLNFYAAFGTSGPDAAKHDGGHDLVLKLEDSGLVRARRVSGWDPQADGGPAYRIDKQVGTAQLDLSDPGSWEGRIQGLVESLLLSDGRPTVLELYAGMGGLAHGAKRAGFRVVGMAERDPHALKTLELNKQDDLLEGRIYDVDLSKPPPFAHLRGKVDVVTGGPPCQPFSRGGDAAGQFDKRDGWPHLLRVVEQVQPGYVVAENVRGLMDTKFQGYRDLIQQELAYRHYASKWVRASGPDFGVAQDRERVFLLAWRKGSAPYREPVHTTEWDAPDLADVIDEWGEMRAEEMRAPVPSALTDKWLKKHPPSDPAAKTTAFTMVARHGAGSVNLVRVPAYKVGGPVLVDDRGESGMEQALARELEAQLDQPEITYFEAAALVDQQGGAAAVSALLDKVMARHGDTWGRGVIDGTITRVDGDAVWLSSPGAGEQRFARRHVYPYAQDVKRMPTSMMAAVQDFPPNYKVSGGLNARGRQIGNAVAPGMGAGIMLGLPIAPELVDLEI